jgi:photosynthetic reaction center cytochrome c subunit
VRDILTHMSFLATVLLVLIPLCAQDAPPPQKKGPPPPKNLKILKADNNLIPIMRSFVQALGAEDCQFCHVKGDFASDDNPKKLTARMMITMAGEINAKFPPVEGKHYVTCYTCHRGKNLPDTAPPPETKGDRL